MVRFIFAGLLTFCSSAIAADSVAIAVGKPCTVTITVNVDAAVTAYAASPKAAADKQTLRAAIMRATKDALDKAYEAMMNTDAQIEAYKLAEQANIAAKLDALKAMRPVITGE